MEEQAFTIVEGLARIAERGDLSQAEARSVIGQIMAGAATSAQIGALLMGLRMKGETIDELAGAAEAMRACVTAVQTVRSPLLDTCGTGGDGHGTYNISTAVAFVAAGAGASVAKHGNRSVSSRSGSADVLEALGVRIDLDAAQMGRCLDEVGIAFLFAPVLHGAMKYAIGPRRELKLRTLFNLLGPLTNPAGARRQLLGVFDPRRAAQMAEVLHRLGTERAWVVCGAGGLDELAIHGPSVAFVVSPEGVRRKRILPEDAGLPRGDEAAARGGDPEENARWLRALLCDEIQGASRDLVLLNAAAALVVSGVARDLKTARRRAEEAIRSGAATEKLERLREASHAV